MSFANEIYNGQFNGNILVVGRTGCGKTTFLEKLAINKFFGNIIKTEWVSGIEIDTSREVMKQEFILQLKKTSSMRFLKFLNLML